MNQTINNYELRRPYKINLKNGQQIQNRQKNKYIVLIHYPNGKHYIFTTYETERRLLERVKHITKHKPKISYLNVYIEHKNEPILEHYGEYTSQLK